jgi:hypothetical protein
MSEMAEVRCECGDSFPDAVGQMCNMGDATDMTTFWDLPCFCPKCGTKFSIVSGTVVVETLRERERDLVRRAWMAGAEAGWWAYRNNEDDVPSPTDEQIEEVLGS